MSTGVIGAELFTYRQCLKDLSILDYRIFRGRRNTRCNACLEPSRVYKKQNRDKVYAARKIWLKTDKAKQITKRIGRNAKLRRYRITHKDFEELLWKQDHKCAICKTIPKRHFCVDHDHVNSKVRGLLCDTCNHGIGNFKDTPEFLQSAIKYLNYWKDKHLEIPISKIPTRS